MNLEELRNQIDVIDDEITTLLNRRMNIVKQVSEYKKQHSIAVMDSSREDEILARVCRGEHEAQLREMFITLFKVSRSVQSRSGI